jgi:hypothetical protein
VVRIVACLQVSAYPGAGQLALFPFLVQMGKSGKNCFKFCTDIQRCGDAINLTFENLSCLLKVAYS